MENIIINKIDQTNVINDTDRYNVSNLNKTDNYEDVINWTNTKNWIYQFRKNFHVLNISNRNDIKWIRDACKIGFITNNFSNMYIEELDDFCERYKNYNDYMKDGVFVRTEHVSLKTGKYKIGPYYNIRSVIESICTSSHSHSPIRLSDNEINIYLIPWININENNEFRIFVHDNNITGISVQHIYKTNTWLSKMNDYEIRIFIRKIIIFFNNEFMEKWKYTASSFLNFMF